MRTISVRPGIDADDGIEAMRLHAAGAVHACVEWSLPADEDDGPVPRDVAERIAAALCACGTVAFRADAPAGASDWYPPQKPAAVSRVSGTVARLIGLSAPLRSGVIVSNVPATVAGLFDFDGWTPCDQIVLAFDPETDHGAIVEAVRGVDDWSERALPAGARLLFGPGHDGAFAAVAATNAGWLDRFAIALAAPE